PRGPVRSHPGIRAVRAPSGDTRGPRVRVPDPEQARGVGRVQVLRDPVRARALPAPAVDHQSSGRSGSVSRATTSIAATGTARYRETTPPTNCDSGLELPGWVKPSATNNTVIVSG